MKLLKTGILALSLTVTATVGLAADYVQGISNMFSGVPVFGSWKIDPTTGKLSSVFQILLSASM
jgi:hypothetical protein